MGFNLKERSLVDIVDLSPQEIRSLLDLAHGLKAEKHRGVAERRLVGKNICLIFEKTSTRTRCAFEVAAYDLGMGVTNLDPAGSQIGHKESIRDTARVLGRMYDAIEYRGFAQSIVDDLAKYAGVPVYNGLTDESHPTQILADFMTMEEHSEKPLSSLACCYLGDARNNMGNSLLLGGAIVGMDMRLCAPRSLWPADSVVTQARAFAAASGARITLADDPKAAVSASTTRHCSSAGATGSFAHAPGTRGSGVSCALTTRSPPSSWTAEIVGAVWSTYGPRPPLRSGLT